MDASHDRTWLVLVAWTYGGAWAILTVCRGDRSDNPGDEGEMRTGGVRMALALLAGVALLGGCGEEDPTIASPDNATPQATVAPAASGSSITGTLGGDAQLEGGCAWISTPEERFEVLYPAGYSVQFEPLLLVDADGGVIAEEGDTLTVEGTRDTGAASICQVGAIWRATAVIVR